MFCRLYHNIRCLFLCSKCCFLILLIFFTAVANGNSVPKQIQIPAKMFFPGSCLPQNPNWPQLRKLTYVSIFFSVVTMGVISTLPSNVSHWPGDIMHMGFSKAARGWWNNVTGLPVWDKDGHTVNYIYHPYFGAVYYVGARDSGFGPWGAFLYSTAMSTFWEYGFEAIVEKPSIQDLLATPIGGWLVGEYVFLPIYNYIQNHDGKLWNSIVLGSVITFLVNPSLNVSTLFGFKVKSYLSLQVDCRSHLKFVNVDEFRPIKSRSVALSVNAVF